MLTEAQYTLVHERGINLSGLLRDLLGDHLAENTITLQVSEDTKHLYDTVVANSGSCDQEIEVHLRKALAAMLECKIAEMEALRARLRQELLSDGNPI